MINSLAPGAPLPDPKDANKCDLNFSTPPKKVVKVVLLKKNKIVTQNLWEIILIVIVPRCPYDLNIIFYLYDSNIFHYRMTKALSCLVRSRIIVCMHVWSMWIVTNFIFKLLLEYFKTSQNQSGLLRKPLDTQSDHKESKQSKTCTFIYLFILYCTSKIVIRRSWESSTRLNSQKILFRDHIDLTILPRDEEYSSDYILCCD